MGGTVDPHHARLLCTRSEQTARQPQGLRHAVLYRKHTRKTQSSPAEPKKGLRPSQVLKGARRESHCPEHSTYLKQSNTDPTTSSASALGSRPAILPILEEK